MQDINYDRLCRTARSEAYLISQGDEPIARVELHFTHAIVYGLLILERDFAESEIAEFIKRIDEDLVVSADLPREDFVVTVYRGNELGVYSDSERSDGEDEGENGVLE